MSTNTREKHSVKDHGEPHGKDHGELHPKPHEKKHHTRGRGVDLVGDQQDLLNRLITDNADLEWAIDQLSNEGPDHKQVHAALLFKRMFRLLSVIEKNSGKRFENQSGKKMPSEKKGVDKMSPIMLPDASLEGSRKKEVLETLSRAPAHEQVLFSTLLQAIEWSIEHVPAATAEKQ